MTNCPLAIAANNLLRVSGDIDRIGGLGGSGGGAFLGEALNIGGGTCDDDAELVGASPEYTVRPFLRLGGFGKCFHCGA